MLLSTKRIHIKHYTKDNQQDFNAILMNDNIMKGIRDKGYTVEIAKQKFKKALLENKKSNDLGFLK